MSKQAVAAVSLPAIRSARARLTELALRTPIVSCAGASPTDGVFLKLENLQPAGSFKIRPVASCVLELPAAALSRGLYTMSSGNSALALAWMARRLGVPATAVVAADAPQAKLSRLRALGARIEQLPFDAWWRAIEAGTHTPEPGTYIDAVRESAALAGDATIGLEIIEQLPQLEAIFVPFGGGALACGIACAVRALKAPTKVIACELDSAQPLGAAWRAGRITETVSHRGFVSGVGFHALLPEMWPLCRELLDGTLTVSLSEVADAIRQLAAGNHIVVEGAGAIPVAAALAGRHPFKTVCAVVSGGNLGNDMLRSILAGEQPS